MERGNLEDLVNMVECGVNEERILRERFCARMVHGELR